MGRNLGFSLNEDGVGGSLVVVPMAIEGVGGSVDRKVRMYDEGALGSLKAYCCTSSQKSWLIRRGRGLLLTMCGLLLRVETERSLTARRGVCRSSPVVVAIFMTAASEVQG